MRVLALAPAPVHGIQIHPHSPRVVPGRTYPFRLRTHCDVGFAVDFDGGFWGLADAAWACSGGNPPPGIDNPYQDGTMILIDARHTRFDVPGGHIHFTRHLGARIVPDLRA